MTTEAHFLKRVNRRVARSRRWGLGHSHRTEPARSRPPRLAPRLRRQPGQRRGPRRAAGPDRWRRRARRAGARDPGHRRPRHGLDPGRPRLIGAPSRYRRHAARNPRCEALHLMSKHGPLRVGIGGPVGSGKTTLVEKLCKQMRGGWSVAVVTNDIYTQEDALILSRLQALPEDRILGVETGGCPHTPLREDASINLAALAESNRRHPDLHLFFIESGGHNLAPPLSPPPAALP